MSAETPFFADRRKRAGLVRRIGNLSTKIDSSDPQLLAMQIQATEKDIDPVRSSHLKHMIACHLEFVSPYSASEINLLAQTTDVKLELATLRSLREDLSNAPEVVRAAFTDVAAVTRSAMEHTS